MSRSHVEKEDARSGVTLVLIGLKKCLKELILDTLLALVVVPPGGKDDNAAPAGNVVDLPPTLLLVATVTRCSVLGDSIGILDDTALVPGALDIELIPDASDSRVLAPGALASSAPDCNALVRNGSDNITGGSSTFNLSGIFANRWSTLENGEVVVPRETPFALLR